MTSRYNPTQGVFETLPPMEVRRGNEIIAIVRRYLRTHRDPARAVQLHTTDALDLQLALKWGPWQPDDAIPDALMGIPLAVDPSVLRGVVQFVDSYPIVVDTSEDVEE